MLGGVVKQMQQVDEVYKIYIWESLILSVNFLDDQRTGYGVDVIEDVEVKGFFDQVGNFILEIDIIIDVLRYV